MSDTEKKKVADWDAIDSKARLSLQFFGFASEPAPNTWQDKLLEAIGDSGMAMVGYPSRYIREEARQAIKGDAIKAFEAAAGKDATEASKPAAKAKPALTM